jgi:dTDP-4-amino-4,6-dideoxygalactose transaminase
LAVKRDIGCLSFNGNKIITAGQGGMLLTNNKKVAEKARYYSTQAKDDPFYFVHSEIGYNYRMNSLSSALLIAQLQKLDSFVEKKREIFEVYKNKLSANRRIRLVEEPENTKSNYWMTAIIAESENLRNEIIKTLENNKIQTRPFWAPLNKQKHLKPFCHKDMKNTEALSSQGLFLPSGVNLTNDQINKVCKVILSFLN